MRLSLSVRIAEHSSAKDRAAMGIEAMAPLARAAGFAALSMRASQVSVASAPARVEAVRALLDREGLGVSMVMGNVALAANTPDAPDVLRHIGPHLDLAERLGCRLVRVMLQRPDDIDAARHAADLAAARGIALAQQTHWGTLAETIDAAIDLVARVDRANFGITLEPANLMACGNGLDRAAVRRIAPYLVNVYFQNVVLDPAGTHRFATRRRGEVRLRYVALDDPSGIALPPLVAWLAEAGYDGWLTVHQPLRDGETVEQAIEEAGRVFRPLVSPAGRSSA